MKLKPVERAFGWMVMVDALTVSMPAYAADLENVETLIHQGVELRHEGKEVQALPVFEKAYEMMRTPRTAGQLGLSELAMGYWLAAEAHLSEALNFPEHPWVGRNLRDLKEALASARKNIGDVVVSGAPSGAEVFINGKKVGRLPLSSPQRLGKGLVDIELRAPGYVTDSRSLKINGGAQETITLTLSPVLELAAPSPGGGAAATRPEASREPTASDSGAREPDVRPRQILAWAAAGVSALSLASAVVETFRWVDKQDEFDNHEGPFVDDPMTSGKNCGVSDPSSGGSGCQDIHNSLALARTLAIIGYGVAGVLGVTSAVLFTASPSKPPRKDMAFSCSPDLIRHGLECGWLF